MESRTHPHVDPAHYQWLHCSDGSYKRLPLAGESMWVHRDRSARALYLGATIQIAQPTAPKKLMEALISTWIWLRYVFPELCMSHNLDAGKSWLKVKIPDVDDAREWALKTLLVRSDAESYGFEKARNVLASVDEPACLFGHIPVVEELSQSHPIFIMIKADHLCMDGIGIRVLMGCFLKALSVELDALIMEPDNTDWSRCEENLSQPWINRLRPNQELAGSGLEEAVNTHNNLFFSWLASDWGFPHQTPFDLGNQKTKFHIFSKESTESLLLAVKKLGDTFTITHLSHAAMILVILKTNPPTKSCSLHSPCWMNGRRYIGLQPHNDNPVDLPHQRHHIPVCQTVADISFANSEELLIRNDATPTEIKSMVIKASKLANVSYTAIPSRNSSLTGIIPVAEKLGETMATRNRSEIIESATRKFADPFFLSDGITENYIQRVYNAVSNPQHSIFTVEDVKFAANAEGPNLVIRLSSWRDQLCLSAEWVQGQYEEEFVVQFLEDMVKTILVLVD